VKGRVFGSGSGLFLLSKNMEANLSEKIIILLVLD
jgi:hypothetical protein